MKKTLKNTLLILVFLTFSISTVLLAYLHFFASEDRKLSGEWNTDLDMTEQAAVTAFHWLQDIEAVSVTLEDVESYMQDLTVQVHLTLEETARFEGTFCSNVLPESYVVCSKAAYEAFAMAFRDLLSERLRMAGYAGSMDKEAIEALVYETFGMSTVEYLMSCGPALLPSLEELQVCYDGSGTYEAAEGILARQFDAGGDVIEKTECYIRQGSMLILSEDFGFHSPLIYTLEMDGELE